MDSGSGSAALGSSFMEHDQIEPKPLHFQNTRQWFVWHLMRLFFMSSSLSKRPSEVVKLWLHVQGSS